MPAFDELRKLYAQLVPFNTLLGVEVVEMGEGTAVTRLPVDPRLLNHLGTQHAAVLFAVGETASGAAVVGLFGDVLRSAVPIARKAQITYRRPASGTIDAAATVVPSVAGLLEGLRKSGRCSFSVAVRLSDESNKRVAEMTVDWLVRCGAWRSLAVFCDRCLSPRWR